MSRRLFTSFALAAALAATGTAEAVPVEFDTFFADSTLRVDYTLAGGAGEAAIYFGKATIDPAGWAGRRHNLDTMPLAGNGALTVRPAGESTVIYKNTFSSLFNEWLSTDQAATTPCSFEHVVLMPMPRGAVDVELALFDARHDTLATIVHRLDPAADQLVRRPAASHQVNPHRYLHRAADPSTAIDVAILAEGYRADEAADFYAHAEAAVASLFSHEPFGSMRDRFNIVAVAVPSADSGVSIPRNADWRDTALGSHFSTFYSARYLTTPCVGRMHDALAGIPYEHIIILANTDEYGGGGIYNSYTLTTARHKDFAPVVVHEFGHSFGGLGDEYFYDDDVMSGSYPADIEPWEPNVTTHPDAPKWQAMLAPGTPVPTPVEQAAEYPVGVYQGAAYTSREAYRPADHCRMRDNQTPGFCPVCQAALRSLIEFYTQPAR